MTIQKPKMLVSNILEKFGILSITSELAGFPKERLHDRRNFDPWAPTSVASQSIIIDAGAALSGAPDTFSMWGHNGDADTITIRVESADDAAITVGVVVHFTQVFGAFQNRTFWKEWANGTTKRYWHILITTHSTILRINQLMIGQRYQFPRFPQNGFTYRDFQLQTVNRRASRGARTGASEDIGERSVPMRFRHFTNTQMDGLENVINQIGGNQFTFAPDYPDFERAYIVNLPDGFKLASPTQQTRQHPNVELEGQNLFDWTT